MRFHLPLLCLFFLLPACAEPLKLFTEEFFPYNYTEKGQVRGVNVELLQQACTLARLECIFQVMPWLRAYEIAQQNPNAGLFSTVRTSKRDPQFQWVGPLGSSTTYLYRLKSRPEVNPTNLEQGKAFSIAVAHGDIFEEYLQQQGYVLDQNLLRVQKKTDAVPLFLSSKIDLLIGSEQVLVSWLAGTGKTPADLEPLLDISHIGNNYLALNLRVKATVVNALQHAVKQLIDQGKLKQLQLKYQTQTMPTEDYLPAASNKVVL